MADRPGAKQELGFPVTYIFGGARSELIPQLFGLNLLAEMEKLVVTDETIGAMMWCIESSIGQIGWKHVPCVDGAPNDTDPKAKRAAEFADQLLVDMEFAWSDYVDDALSMIWAGFAPCEVVLKQRDGVDSRFSDGRWGVEGLPLLDQSTIVNWVREGRKIVALQQATPLGSATIPLWKIANFKIKGSASNPLGRSLFTNIHRIWRLKRRIQDSEAIGIDRDLAGLPTFRMPSQEITRANETDTLGAPTPEAVAAQGRIQAGINAVSNLRFNEKGGLVLPSDPWSSAEEDTQSNTPMWDFKITTSAGQRTIDTRNAVRDYDRGMARIALMQFLHLGDRSSGSFGLSDDQSSMAIRSLMFLTSKIGAAWTRSALPLVWEVNAMNKKYMPKLEPDDINKNNIAQIGQYFNGLGKALELIQNDPEARVEALALAGITTTRERQVMPSGAVAAPADSSATASGAVSGSDSEAGRARAPST